MIDIDKGIPSLFARIFMIVAGLTGAVAAAAEEPARVRAATPDEMSPILLVADAWPPYNCAEDDENEGYMVDVARRIFEPLGYRVVYRNVTWERALLGTRDGLFDGVIAPSPVECPECVFPGYPLYNNQVSFYVRADSDWEYTGPDDLARVTLGVARGYDYFPWLNEYIERNADRPDRVQAIAGDYPLPRNLRKLVSGRIDVVADNEGSIRFTAGRLGLLERIKPAGRDSVLGPCYIAFTPVSPRSATLAALLDRGFMELYRTGELEAILARYDLDLSVTPFRADRSGR